MSSDLAIWTPPPMVDDPLLAAKFVIPEPAHFMVPRPRLVKLLSPAAPGPMTLVVGPAGSGKTQLVASWANGGRAADHVAWITLDDEDAEASRFWTYLVAGLRRAGIPLPSLSAPAPTDVTHSFLVRLAADLAEQPDSVVLVLDGVSEFTGQQWATDLEFVVRHACRRLRLVLVGRGDPPIPLHRYRLAGLLVEVRTADLAFTGDEAAALLGLHGVALSTPALNSLLEHTEGWAAGIRLFALAVQGRADADSAVDTIAGDEAHIAEYFSGEVLRAQPPEVRDFLLRTSVLDTITAELAQALTGRADAARVLAELTRGNSFVQPTGEPSGGHRYHRLFAELLRAQLAYEDPDEVPRLHRRAAHWLAEHGQLTSAVTHAVMAGDWGTAATWVIDNYEIGSLLLSGRAGPLGTLLRQLPDDVDLPEAAVVCAALAIADGRLDRCAADLARAEGLVVNSGCAYSDALALADTVVQLRLSVARRDMPRALYLASAAESLLALAPAAQVNGHPHMRLLVLAERGVAQSWAGAVDDAAATLADAAAHAGAPDSSIKINCLGHLALIEAYRGRLSHAERLAAEAVGVAEQCDILPPHRPAAAAVASAWVAVERYDIESAGRHLRAADPGEAGTTDGLVSAAYALVKSRRLQARGELRGAMKTLRDIETADTVPAWLAQEITLTRARLLTITGRADEGLALLGELDDRTSTQVAVTRAAALLATGAPAEAAAVVTPIAEANGVRSPVAVDAWLVLASSAAHTGELGRARHALREAMRLAAPEGQRRAVQQVWARLRRILRDDEELTEQYRALNDGPRRVDRAQAGGCGEPTERVIVDPLSKRELEVLHGMAAMLPTEEIAASMYVSVNTVKSHVRSILRKLSASRRNEAVRRARALGVI